MKKNIFRALFQITLFIILFSACKNPLNTTKVEKVETKYEVHHRREKIDGTFNKEDDEVEIITGFVGDMTDAKPLTTSLYNGFDPQYYQQKVISTQTPTPHNITCMQVHYTARLHTNTFTNIHITRTYSLHIVYCISTLHICSTNPA